MEFRYALRPHTGYDAAAASRLAIGMTQPLVVSKSSAIAIVPPPLRIEPADVLALALKPSDDGEAWMVRVFGASGDDRKAKVSWSAKTAPKMWISDTNERTIEPVAGDEVPVGGWDVVTLRAERHS